MDIIKDFMSKPVLSVTIQASAEETAKEMDQKRVSCLLVKENEEDGRYYKEHSKKNEYDISLRLGLNKSTFL